MSTTEIYTLSLHDALPICMRVVTDLKAKGVHGEVIEKAVSSAYDEVNEERQARAYLSRKRLQKPKDRKSTRLNSSHVAISYAVFCLKKKTVLVRVVIIVFI